MPANLSSHSSRHYESSLLYTDQRPSGATPNNMLPRMTKTGGLCSALKTKTLMPKSKFQKLQSPPGINISVLKQNNDDIYDDNNDSFSSSNNCSMNNH